MKKILFSLLLLSITSIGFSQERVVNVDFEASSFQKNPSIPFEEPFVIQGEIREETEYVEATIYVQNSDKPLHTFAWNRNYNNKTNTFEVVIPAVLQSNSEYDFRIATFKLMSDRQKDKLRQNLRERIVYFLQSNMSYNGKDVEINKPKHVYRELCSLVKEALKYQRSKNAIEKPVLSSLIYEELKRYDDFHFSKLLKKQEGISKDSLATKVVTKKVNSLADIIISEVTPYLNTDLVQLHRAVEIQAVATDKESFTLPVNAGMYVWSKSVDINNTTTKNLDFTPGIGFTIPFANKTSLFSKSRLFDSFGYSMGVLINPVKDASGQEFITPGINMPVYAALGFRLFKVVRLNAGALILAEDGMQNFSNLIVLPTAGLALELDIWMGIKK